MKAALATVFLAFLAQMTLNPVIAPLARETGLAEWQIGVMISTAALAIVITSGAWGRRSQSWGRRPVLLIALSVCLTALTGFAVAAGAGLAGLVTGPALFVVFLVTRGVLFGAGLAAVGPTVQAYIANGTATESERVRGIAGVGAMQGLALTIGAVLGAALGGISLLGPIVAAPIVIGAALVLVAVAIRRQQPDELITRPPRVSPRDPRVFPYLLIGFGMFTALGFIQIITGFLVQDRLGLDSEATALVTGLTLLAAGVGLLLAQAVIVPRTGWHPVRLLRVGCAVALGGFTLLTVDLSLWGILVAIFATGVGLGIAAPGYIAGPTLLVTRQEQGGLAGLVGANNALTFIVAPTAATTLYGITPVLPVAVGAIIIAACLTYAWTGPVFRRSRHRPQPDVGMLPVATPEDTPPTDLPTDLGQR